MKISVMIPPCVRCLQTCPGCQHLPKEIRRSQAEVALSLLKEMFPWIPDPEEGEDREERS